MVFGTKTIAWLWCINILLFVVMIAASLTVDGNGRFFGMNETASYFTVVSIVILGLTVTGLVAFVDKKGTHRVMAAVIAIVYLLMIAPAVL